MMLALIVALALALVATVCALAREIRMRRGAWPRKVIRAEFTGSMELGDAFFAAAQ